MADIFTPGTRVHILGVGGAGMSALATFLHGRGCVVSGCDAVGSVVLAELADAGIPVAVGHDPAHVTDVDVVTATPAIRESEPELAVARAAGTRVLTRPAVMAALCATGPVVAVAGTHGKTTTTSMAAHVWVAADQPVGWLVGAPVVGLGSGGVWGSGDLLVEADESYGTFARMTPAALGVTAVDADHLDHYGDEDGVRAAFAALIDATTGPVVVTDHPGAQLALARAGRAATTVVGRAVGCDLVITDERHAAHGSRFTLRTGGPDIEVTLSVPGALNVTNASVAAALALARGVPHDAIASGLAAFRGAPRRFEVVGVRAGTTVVVDYAHLPAEVALTIAAAHEIGHRRVAAIFQPHRVTRTVALAASFAGAFAGTDELVVTDIYTAGEPNPTGLTGEVVAAAVARGPHAPRVSYVASLAEAATRARAWTGHVDVILILGAGDIVTVADLIVGDA